MTEAKEYRKKCLLCKKPLIIPVWKLCELCTKEVAVAKRWIKTKDIKKQEKGKKLLAKLNK